jgi:hypothetical protein
MSLDFMTADIREVIDTLYWVSDRSSSARIDWNTDIFEWVSRIDEDDYE